MLCDAGPQESFESVVSLLHTRFGQQGQAERFRAEIKAKKRMEGESLQELYQDICCLISLAYPHEPGSHSKAILARNAFLDALNDQRLYTRILEKEPQTIEAALTEACKLEAFTPRLVTRELMALIRMLSDVDAQEGRQRGGRRVRFMTTKKRVRILVE